MKQVEKFIPQAVRLIKENESLANGTDTVPSVYKGYVSSMGASIILSGLVPTLAFYNSTGDNSSSKEERRPLLEILRGLLKDRHAGLETRSLFEYALSLQESGEREREQLRQLRRDIINASIAVKLALRSFHMEGEA